MNQHEDKALLAELLGSSELSALRQDTLQRGLSALRWRKRRRVATQIGAALGLPLVLGAAVMLLNSHPPHSRPSRLLPASVPPKIRTITDEELFALFPGRPMALIGKPGQQQFLFLDQAVAARFHRSQL